MRRLAWDKAYYLKIISDYGPGLSLHIHFMLVNPCKTGCWQGFRSLKKEGEVREGFPCLSREKGDFFFPFTLFSFFFFFCLVWMFLGMATSTQLWCCFSPWYRGARAVPWKKTNVQCHHPYSGVSSALPFPGTAHKLRALQWAVFMGPVFWGVSSRMKNSPLMVFLP